MRINPAVVAPEPGALRDSRHAIRVIRGGSWLNPSWYLRASGRGWDLPGLWLGNFGFRLVLEVL